MPTIENSTAPAVERVSPITRKMGIEIEYIQPLRLTSETQSELRAIGCDVTSDSSIRANGLYAYEIRISPCENGPDFETRIKKVCDILAEVGATINATCGVHVHADAEPIAISKIIRTTPKTGFKPVFVHYRAIESAGADNDQLGVAKLVERSDATFTEVEAERYGVGYVIGGVPVGTVQSPSTGRYVLSDDGNLVRYYVDTRALKTARTQLHNAMTFYAAIDPILRSMVPASRRRNRYCYPFAKMVKSGGACPNSIVELYQAISERYCGINLMSLQRHGTVENRYHQGSTNADKIIAWARLWSRCTDIALSSSAHTEAERLNEIVNTGNKLDMFMALLGLPSETEKNLRERVRVYAKGDGQLAQAYIAEKLLYRSQVAA